MSIFKKLRYKKEYQEYTDIQQRLRHKQIQSSQVFNEVNNDPNRHTGTDPELRRLNDEANQLAMRLVELNEKFDKNKRIRRKR